MSGIKISAPTFDEILNDMDAHIQQNSKKNYICITNTESMYHALRIEKHLEYINGANHSLCDGIGVVIASKFWGLNIPRRNGPILMLKACEFGQTKNWKHFFLGGKEGVADLMHKKLLQKYQNLNVVGTYCPPFRDMNSKEKQNLNTYITQTKPDIIWVGLGLLKQEKWIQDNLNTLHVPWMIGVGAAFDYHAGTVIWAPRILQKMGLEWLYRLMVQPKLRFIRYVWSFQFMFHSILQAIITRFKNRDQKELH